MRIAYLLGENLASHPGLREKIFGQVQEWCAHGHECFLVMHGVGQVVGSAGNVLMQNAGLSGAQRNIGKLRKLLLLQRQYDFVLKALEHIKPDITYSRYMFPIPGLKRALHEAGPLIVEVNSNDKSEYFSNHVCTGLYNLMFRHQLLNRADGLIFVTKELASSTAFRGYNARRMVIANGVKAGSFPFVEDTGNDHPQLCFIGSPGQSWQGLDKLSMLAAGLPECTLHIIGPTEKECLDAWRSRPPNVLFHGYLDGHTASELVSRMDVGISTLALHRKGMNEACPLKVRQYIASGLPVIASHLDTDIAEDCDFFLRLPNNEANISANLPDVARFVRRVFRNNGLRAAIRQYAVSHMDVSQKEESRLRFFESLRDDSP